MHRLFLALILAALPLHAAEFSVYLAPPEMNANGRALASVGDLHISVNDQAVPIQLVEGRQSIAYPCNPGAKIELFRVANDEKKTRSVVASAAMPGNASSGLLVLSATESGYKVAPFWFSSADLVDGTNVFVNLSGQTLGVVVGEKRMQLKPGIRWVFKGEFKGEQVLALNQVQIFARRGDSSSALARIMNCQVGVPKDDAGICLILPKNGNRVTLLNLERGGLRDASAKEELGKKIGLKGTSAKVEEAVAANS